MFIAFVLIILGVLFFARATNLISPELLNVIWPLVLIVIGLGLLSNRTFGHHCNDKNCWRCREVSMNEKGGKRRS